MKMPSSAQAHNASNRCCVVEFLGQLELPMRGCDYAASRVSWMLDKAPSSSLFGYHDLVATHSTRGDCSCVFATMQHDYEQRKKMKHSPSIGSSWGKEDVATVSVGNATHTCPCRLDTLKGVGASESAVSRFKEAIGYNYEDKSSAVIAEGSRRCRFRGGFNRLNDRTRNTGEAKDGKNKMQ